MTAALAPRVISLAIRGLFGACNYDLPDEARGPFGESVILYGDNGSGKTTILQLVFHMLSPAHDRGHRGQSQLFPSSL